MNTVKPLWNITGKRLRKRIAAGEVSGEKIMRLQAERKHIATCIKLAAYQAES